MKLKFNNLNARWQDKDGVKLPERPHADACTHSMRLNPEEKKAYISVLLHFSRNKPRVMLTLLAILEYTCSSTAVPSPKGFYLTLKRPWKQLTEKLTVKPVYSINLQSWHAQDTTTLKTPRCAVSLLAYFWERRNETLRRKCTHLFPCL